VQVEVGHVPADRHAAPPREGTRVDPRPGHDEKPQVGVVPADQRHGVEGPAQEGRTDP
jgi:hypothetical protein